MPPLFDLPAASFETGTLGYTFTRPADSLDDYYLVQHSANLVDWDDLSATPFVGSVTIHPDGTESVTLSIPLDHPAFTGPERFIRLKALRP